MTDAVRVLYIGGVSHSGSTLLARILGGVDGLFAAGEVYALSERITNGDRCGCGATLEDCPFWSSVLRLAFARGDALPRVRTQRRWIKGRTLPLLALGRERRRVNAYQADLAKLYRAIAAVSGCRVIVDSSKSPTYAYILDRIRDIDLYGVHLVRDARATSYSWSVDPHFHRTRGPTFGARWLLWNLELELLRVGRPGRFTRIRFEDFLEQPIGQVRRILAVVGAEDAEVPFVDDRSVRLPAHHMVEGHSSRFDVGVIPIRANTTWTRRLSTRREISTSLLALPLQLLYRYPIARRRVA